MQRQGALVSAVLVALGLAVSLLAVWPSPAPQESLAPSPREAGDEERAPTLVGMATRPVEHEPSAAAHEMQVELDGQTLRIGGRTVRLDGQTLRLQGTPVRGRVVLDGLTAAEVVHRSPPRDARAPVERLLASGESPMLDAIRLQLWRTRVSEDDVREYGRRAADPRRAFNLAALKGLLDLVPLDRTTTPREREEIVRRVREQAGADFPVATIVAALEHEDAWIRTRATWLLPYLLDEADPALEVVERMLRTERADLWHTATAALEALRAVPGDRSPVLAVLYDAVLRPDHPERHTAIRCYLRHADLETQAQPLAAELVRYEPGEAGLTAQLELAHRRR